MICTKTTIFVQFLHSIQNTILNLFFHHNIYAQNNRAIKKAEKQGLVF